MEITTKYITACLQDLLDYRVSVNKLSDTTLETLEPLLYIVESLCDDITVLCDYITDWQRGIH